MSATATVRLPAAVTRRAAVGLFAAATAAAVAADVLYTFDPMRYGFYPRCILYVLTGIYCPGCGVLRASHALLHGRVVTALHYNALFVTVLPFAAYKAGAFLIETATGARLSTFQLSGKQARVIFWVVVAFGVLRNIPLYPFNLLAP